MPGLTSHVLDTVHGCPAAGVRVTLLRIDEAAGTESMTELGTSVTNADGRTDPPLLSADALASGGTFELRFDLGAYFAASGDDTGVFDAVPVRVTVATGLTSLHVPLLASPWSYTTYRGS